MNEQADTVLTRKANVPQIQHKISVRRTKHCFYRKQQKKFTFINIRKDKSGHKTSPPTSAPSSNDTSVCLK